MRRSTILSLPLQPLFPGPANSLVVARNWWPIILSKISYFFKFSQTGMKKTKDSKSVLIFFSSIRDG